MSLGWRVGVLFRMVCLFACDVLGGLLVMILGSFLLGLTLGVVYVNCLVVLWLVWWGELYFV